MDFIEKNNKIKIVPADIKGSVNGYINDKQEGFFSVKIENFQSQFFQQNSLVEVIILCDSYLVSFNTKILNLNENCVQLLFPKNYRLVQRREFTRVDIDIPIKIKEFEQETEEESVTENISGGGLQLCVSKKFDYGAKLKVKLKIINNKDIDTVIEVLRVNNSQFENKFSVAGKFIKISNIDRTVLIQLCFKKQLEQKYKNIKSLEGENKN